MKYFKFTILKDKLGLGCTKIVRMYETESLEEAMVLYEKEKEEKKEVYIDYEISDIEIIN